MLVAESRMVMGKAHVFHVGSLSDLLEKAGTNLTEPYVSPIKGDRYKGLWELRVKFASDITRVFYFTFQGDTFVLLHGFKKKTNKTPESELERALKYKKDFERRNSDD